MITLPDIENRLQEAFPDGDVTIRDVRGDGSHYAVCVKSPSFEGKSRVEQHRMVYQTLEGHIGTEIHAFALQTEVLSKS